MALADSALSCFRGVWEGRSVSVELRMPLPASLEQPAGQTRPSVSLPVLGWGEVAASLPTGQAGAPRGGQGRVTNSTLRNKSGQQGVRVTVGAGVTELRTACRPGRGTGTACALEPCSPGGPGVSPESVSPSPAHKAGRQGLGGQTAPGAPWRAGVPSAAGDRGGLPGPWQGGATELAETQGSRGPDKP